MTKALIHARGCAVKNTTDWMANLAENFVSKYSMCSRYNPYGLRRNFDPEDKTCKEVVQLHLTHELSKLDRKELETDPVNFLYDLTDIENDLCKSCRRLFFDEVDVQIKYVWEHLPEWFLIK